MSHFLTPAAVYLNRRNELLAERSVVQSGYFAVLLHPPGGAARLSITRQQPA